MPVTSIGWVHFVLAIAAIAVGAAISLTRKGSPRHRTLGRWYAWLMVGVNVTAFTLYGLFGTFGPFHVAAVVSLATVIAGWVPVKRKPKAWMERHATFMSWSYVGLLAAAAAETLSRISDTPFWTMVTIGSIGVIIVGAVVIHHRVPKILAQFGR